MNDEHILEMTGITKAFPGTLALDNVLLRVKKGSVHAVIGENGAGKSTLMKILLGLYRADGGSIRFKGEAMDFKNPNDALSKGIAMIHQELANVPERNVAQNIFLGKELTYGVTPILNEREMCRRTGELLARLNIAIDPRARMKDLTVSQQQLCEIAKAVSYNADLIIMDEPTSSIMEDDVDHLFDIIRDLRANGITIIYISHKMDELFRI